MQTNLLLPSIHLSLLTSEELIDDNPCALRLSLIMGNVAQKQEEEKGDNR